MNKNKKSIEEQHARRLVARFLDGDTTAAEESWLYAFFRNAADLPADLESCRDMFGWYAAMAPAAAPRRPWLRYASIAAVVALVLTAGLFIIKGKDPSADRSTLYASYQGSYVIRDGVRITDISQIYTTLSRAEATADSIDRLFDRQICSTSADADEDIVRRALANIGDPELVDRLTKEILQQ